MTQPRRLSQEQESSLLVRLRAREESALAELYDHLAPWVLGLAQRIMGDADEAEDVLSDVFVQVWARINQHDSSRGPLVPWVLSIARNRALDLLRKRRRWSRKLERVADAHDCEERDHRLRDVRQVRGDPIARLHTLRLQVQRQRRDLLA